MTKRQATKIAYGIAYRAVQKALDVGGYEAETDTVGGDFGNTLGPDQAKVEDALDRIAQRFFELSQ